MLKMRMRGTAPLPGLQTMRITADGVQVFPRIVKKVEEADYPRPTRPPVHGSDQAG